MPSKGNKSTAGPLHDVARLQARVEQLEGAIRKHRTMRTEITDYINDRELYAVLPEGVEPGTVGPVDWRERANRWRVVGLAEACRAADAGDVRPSPDDLARRIGIGVAAGLTAAVR